MKVLLAVSIFLIGGLGLIIYDVEKGTINFPYPSHVDYTYGSISPTSNTQKEKDKIVSDYYDIWKKNYLIKEINSNSPLYRIATDIKDKTRTVSEAQGYGMIITAIMAGYDKDAREIFDGLWKFSRQYPSSISPDLMAWEIPKKVKNSNSAFDGDTDMAYALLMADKQWGSAGNIHYANEAKKLIEAIYKYTIGKDSKLPLLGDWEDPHGEKFNQFTPRTSDFMLRNFRSFYDFTKDNRWLEVLEASQLALISFQKYSTPHTGLVSDFIKFDYEKNYFVPTEQHFLETHDNAFYYNACRVPLRVAMDALLSGDDKSIDITQNISSWIISTTKGDPTLIKGGYMMDGKVIGNFFTTAFASPLAVASMLSPKDQIWLNKNYDFIKDRVENYYEDSLNLLSLLVLSDNFWDSARTPK